MTESIIYYADEIRRIIEDCEYVQRNGGSGYEKEQAKMSAYNAILELIKGEE